ncbi:MAG: hypothetical protein J2O46_05970 [Nocardioides sp.]|nr:hypothetical protein [Nocardioides sp.]
MATFKDNVQRGIDSARPALDDAKVKSGPHLVTGGQRTVEKAGEVKARIAAKQAEVTTADDAESPAKKAIAGLLQIADAVTDVAAQAGEWAKDTGSKWGLNDDDHDVVQPAKELPDGDVPPPPPPA